MSAGSLRTASIFQPSGNTGPSGQKNRLAHWESSWCSRLANPGLQEINTQLELIVCYQLMPSSHCTILARFFTRQQVLINRRQMPEIGGKSELVPASDNPAVWIIKDTIWGNPRHVADAREIFGMLNIWSCLRFSILLCEWVLTGSDWKIHRRWPTANERARYRAAGSSRRDFFFFFFFNKASIRIYRTGRLHEDQEGARVFPVNYILL